MALIETDFTELMEASEAVIGKFGSKQFYPDDPKIRRLELAINFIKLQQDEESE